MQVDAQPRYILMGRKIFYLGWIRKEKRLDLLNLGAQREKQITKGNDNRYTKGPEVDSWSEKYMIRFPAGRWWIPNKQYCYIMSMEALAVGDGQRANGIGGLLRRCLQHDDANMFGHRKKMESWPNNAQCTITRISLWSRDRVKYPANVRYGSHIRPTSI